MRNREFKKGLLKIGMTSRPPYERANELGSKWAASIVDVIERSRNVIMHSGTLERPDIERIGSFIRDWVKQVGA